MKKSKTEKAIIDLIEMRQMELTTEALQVAIETFESPPKTFRKALKVAGLLMGYMLRISQLQRAKRIIEPKPEMAKGGIISKGEEDIITDKGKKIILDNEERIPYRFPGHRNPPPPPTRPKGRRISKIEQRYIDELDY